MNIEKQKRLKLKCIIGSIICIILGFLFLKLFIDVNYSMRNDCKMCSVFEKDCKFTDEELLEQEYGDNVFCRDLGIYEMEFKIFGMLMLTFFVLPIVMLPEILPLRKPIKKL